MPPLLKSYLADRIAYSNPSGPCSLREVRALARAWTLLWKLPSTLALPHIDYCVGAPARMGEFEMATTTIWLNGPYLTLYPELLQESLCHQLAHWVVWGVRMQAGPDSLALWLRLMQQAGYRGTTPCNACQPPRPRRNARASARPRLEAFATIQRAA